MRRGVTQCELLALGRNAGAADHQLARLPSTVIEIQPAWRGFEFFMVGDQIVVVDPHNLHIVASSTSDRRPGYEDRPVAPAPFRLSCDVAVGPDFLALEDDVAGHEQHDAAGDQRHRLRPGGASRLCASGSGAPITAPWSW